MRRKHKSPKDELIATKLAIEKARLAKLEEGLPKPTPQYTRYEDLPPPSPEERERLVERFKALYYRLKDQDAAEKQAWLLSMVDYAP